MVMNNMNENKTITLIVMIFYVCFMLSMQHYMGSFPRVFQEKNALLPLKKSAWGKLEPMQKA
jgi:hypothetical protein